MVTIMQTIAEPARLYYPPRPVLHARHYATTRVERTALFSIVVLLPLQDYLPTISGLSTLWIMFAILGAYVLLNRPKALARVVRHPVFLAFYLLVLLGLVLESYHSHSDYQSILRLAQMGGGGVLIATVCRDPKAVKALALGVMVAGLWVSVYSLMLAVGVFSGASVVGFSQASALRSQIWVGNELSFNPNGAAAAAAGGAVVATTFLLASPVARYRWLLALILGISVLGAFSTMSRGGIGNLIISLVVVLVVSSGGIGRRGVLLVGLTLLVVLLVPDVVWERMTFTLDPEGEAAGARTRVYAAALHYIPEHIWLGVGSGNFWGEWGLQSQFASLRAQDYSVSGSHNSLAQITLLYGLPGLVLFLLVIWRLYRHIPDRSSRWPFERLLIVGLGVSALVHLQVTHGYYNKSFSVVIGLIVGFGTWVWKREREQRPIQAIERLGYLRP